MRSDIDPILMRIAAGARLTGAAWVALLVVIVHVAFDAELDGSLVPAATAVVVGTWAIGTVQAFRNEPRRHVATPTLTVDTVMAAGALVASDAVSADMPTIAGGLPLIVVAIAAIAGRTQAWIVTGVMIVTTLVVRGDSAPGLTDSASSIVLYVAGASILVWVVGTLRESDERRMVAEDQRRDADAARARAEERNEISRHLHDSVLQTLALAQRREDVPREVTVLFRRQERELREWLFGGGVDEGTFRKALVAAAHDVEQLYAVPVDVVVSGDIDLDDGVHAIVDAAREAVTNAARHSGAEVVSVFGEVVGGAVRVFVRDRGTGFDPSNIAPERMGVRESIIGRMRDRAGSADVRSEPGFGTEWRLELPR